MDYEFKCHLRAPLFSPEELQKVSPMGTAPVLQVFRAGSDKPVTIGESGNIAQFLLENYDKSGKLKPESFEDQILVNYYLHFAEASLQAFLTPHLIKYFYLQLDPENKEQVEDTLTKVNNMYFTRQVWKSLDMLENLLAEKGGGYLVGDKLTAADIIMEYPLFESFFFEGEPEKRIGQKLSKDKYPHLYEWAALIEKNPSRLKAAAKEQEEVKKAKAAQGQQ